MSTGSDGREALPFEDANRIPIARLSPDIDTTGRSHVEANVALIWPYSSSTQRLSLLLTEKDVRLRKFKGQVKVTIHGECAKEVAATHIGIGDYVKLGLQDVTWLRTGEEVSTPGKKVDWDIGISRRIILEVQRVEGTQALVDFVARPELPAYNTSSIVSIDGPKTNGFINIRKTRLSVTNFPTHRSHHRVSSGSFVDASLDPFADDDGYIVGKGRKRTKFARYSGSWQLLDDETDISIQKEKATTATVPDQEALLTGLQDAPLTIKTPENVVIETEGFDDNHVQAVTPPLEEDTRDEEPTTPLESNTDLRSDRQDFPDALMAPPPIPSPTLSRSQLPGPIQIDTHVLATPTPVLRPLPSPGLALVSPLVQRHGMSSGYFPNLFGQQSEIDAISHPPPLRREGVVAAVEPEAPNELFDIHQPTLEVGSDHVVGEHENFVGGRIASAVEVIPTIQADVSNRPPDVLDQVSLAQAAFDTYLSTEALQLPPTISGVDLDALQQQIEESNSSWLDPAPAQIEDEDMYGPSVEDREVDEHTQVSEGTEAQTDVSQQSPSMQSSPSSESETSMLRSPRIMHDEHVLQPDHAILGGNTPQDAMVIDSSEEESEVNVGQARETKDEGNEEDDKSVGMAKVLKKALGFANNSEDEQDESSASEDSLSSPLREDAEPLPSTLESIDNTAASTLLASSPVDRDIGHIDGVYETYEDENQRNYFRAESQVATLSEILPYSTEVDKALSLTYPTFLSNRTEGVRHIESAEVSEEDDVPEGAESEAVEEDELEAYSIDIDESQDAASDIEITRVAELQADPSEFAQVKQQDGISQMMTPAATQQTNMPIQDALPFTNSLPTQLPLSPLPTQDTSTFDTGSTSADVLPAHSHHSTHETMPFEVQEEEVSRPPRSSQRLSRRSFTSEKVATNYFTPRRSTRNIQSSPTIAPKALPTGRQSMSPLRFQRVLRSSSPTMSRQHETPTMLTSKASRGRKTSLSYYPHLSTLAQYFNLQVDIVAVCTADTPTLVKSRTGPKDYYTILCLADSSFTDNTTVRVEIFRPREAALPSAKRGDVVLLRNMKVLTNSRKVMLLSTGTSAWAIFRQEAGQALNVTTQGPPIEYDDEEEAAAKDLLKWWSIEGDQRYPNFPVPIGANEDNQDTRPRSPMVTRSQRRKTNRTDNIENSFDHSPSIGPQHLETAISVTDSFVSRESQEPTSPVSVMQASRPQLESSPSSPTAIPKQGSHRRGNGRRSTSVVHELRDGTKYVDHDGRHRGSSVIHKLRDGHTYIDE